MNSKSSAVIEGYKRHKLSICVHTQMKCFIDDMQAEEMANRRLACFGLGLLVALAIVSAFIFFNMQTMIIS